MPKHASTLIIAFSILAILPSVTEAQMPPDVARLIHEGDSLHRAYRFRSALDAYDGVIKALGDSAGTLALGDRIAISRNALRMTGYCTSPTVVARERFPLSSFFLYYPLPDKSWHALADQADSTTSLNHLCPFIYAPENTEATLPFSPESLPMPSPDGETIFFTSKDLDGIGGYDLYSSSFDSSTGEWSAPVNLGYPFNSPADDFLLLNTSDGRYTIFASNRNSPSDSVDIYVLEYDPAPTRRAITAPEELCSLQELDPLRDPLRFDNSSTVESMPDNSAIKRYMDLTAKARALQDSLSRTRKEIQQMEAEFLRDGIAFNLDGVQNSADREVVGAGKGYTFTRHNMGAPLIFVVFEK